MTSLNHGISKISSLEASLIPYPSCAKDWCQERYTDNHTARLEFCDSENSTTGPQGRMFQAIARRGVRFHLLRPNNAVVLFPPHSNLRKYSSVRALTQLLVGDVGNECTAPRRTLQTSGSVPGRLKEVVLSPTAPIKRYCCISKRAA